MRLTSQAQIALFFFASSSAFNISQAASFSAIDCDQASNSVERMICANKNLNRLDKQVAQQITAAAEVSKVPQKILKATQQQWISTRDQCEQADCIEESYQSRLTELKRYNLTDQHFVQHFMRIKQDGTPTHALSVMELHKLDEKRTRVIINSYARLQSGSLKANHAEFSAYGTLSNRMKIKDLDTKCLMQVQRIDDNNIKISQKSSSCGTSRIHFSGRYQLVS